MSRSRITAALFALAWISVAGSAAVNINTHSPLHRFVAPPPSSTSGQHRFQAATHAFGGYMPYHNGETLICSDCHTMHASEQHSWDGAPDLQNVPAKHLLRRATALDVCVSCHDGVAGIPDVIETDVNGLAERSGGLMMSAGVPNFRGHNLDRDPDALSGDLCSRCHFVGSMATASVTCIDCHNPHGNNKMRNLQWASAPGGEPDFGIIERPGTTGVAKYERSNVAYAYDSSGLAREVTNMCIDCHHSFFSPSYTNESNGHFMRHPGTNSEWGFSAPINRQGANTDPAHWVAGTGSGFVGTPRLPFVVRDATTFAQATTVDGSNEVFCLSCHVAHGSDHAFSLRWDPTQSPYPRGCDQCHNVAG